MRTNVGNNFIQQLWMHYARQLAAYAYSHSHVHAPTSITWVAPDLRRCAASRPTRPTTTLTSACGRTNQSSDSARCTCWLCCQPGTLAALLPEGQRGGQPATTGAPDCSHAASSHAAAAGSDWAHSRHACCGCLGLAEGQGSSSVVGARLRGGGCAAAIVAPADACCAWLEGVGGGSAQPVGRGASLVHCVVEGACLMGGCGWC